MRNINEISRIKDICRNYWNKFWTVVSKSGQSTLEMYLSRGIGRLHVTSHISRQKKWMTKGSNLCWRGIGRTPTFRVILKTNEKII